MSATSSNLAQVGICSTTRHQLTDFDRSIIQPLLPNQPQGVGREDDGKVLGRHSDQRLVGFHIMDKTRYRPQWLWSTFEHVDNVPPTGQGEAREPDAQDAGAPYSYFDASKRDRRLPLLGSAETLPISMRNPPKLDPEPMQVTRRHPVHPSTMATNRAYWALPGIKGTVWERYMLVASQWPTVTVPP